MPACCNCDDRILHEQVTTTCSTCRNINIFFTDIEKERPKKCSVVVREKEKKRALGQVRGLGTDIPRNSLRASSKEDGSVVYTVVVVLKHHPYNECFDTVCDRFMLCDQLI